MNLLALLAAVDDGGVSVSKDTLIVIALVLVIVVALLFIFGRRWRR